MAHEAVHGKPALPDNIVILDGPTILAGESLSDGLDVSAGDIVRITVPQEYTAAKLTFQASSDGNLYNDLHTSTGLEISVVAKPSTGVVIADVWVRSINFIKFRSGSRNAPVVQRENCKFAVAIEVPLAVAGDPAGEPVAEGEHRKGKKSW